VYVSATAEKLPDTFGSSHPAHPTTLEAPWVKSHNFVAPVTDALLYVGLEVDIDPLLTAASASRMMLFPELTGLVKLPDHEPPAWVMI
jgi:hypothetical protein